jgi:pimeloyl-ACP methyl ester carboxylesterase
MKRERLADLECWVTGRGPTVVLLHGFPDVPEGWHPVMERLQGRFRLVAPYMPGYAPSPTDGPFDVDSLSDRIDALLAVVADGAPVHLVGHDWGSVVAQQVLMRHPERVKRAVTMSVPHPLAFLSHTATSPRQLALSAYMFFFQLPFLPESTLRANDFAILRWLWNRWSPDVVLPDDYWPALTKSLSESLPAPLEYYRGILRPVVPQIRRMRAAADLRIPHDVLYLCGRHDKAVGPEARRGQRKYFSGRLEEVELDAGHFLQLEIPDEIAARIAEWLEPSQP